MMKFEKAARDRCKIKMSIQGPSGSGKSYSALQVARGLVKDLAKVAVIDSENGSAHLYSHLGDYSVLTLKPPFSPERYIQAIEYAISEGFECVIVDSLSHEWNGSGGILEIHSQMTGNSFTNWSKLTPRHNALLQTIINAEVHIISTLRSKTDYVIENKNGKNVPQKVGLKGVQREDVEYEFTLAFELNQNHVATISKDRTGLFKDIVELNLDESVGQEILAWCNTPTQHSNPIESARKNFDSGPKSFEEIIDQCSDLESLNELFKENPGMRGMHKADFHRKSIELSNNLKHHQNGTIAK